ncbi:arabinose efflux permease [Longilinea arvoryzae]|uniref:Arabinose efflux permease n=1 Tax=Longilinea arvoryzae TaxID=360412 RepID=A0A0S7BDE4_9CHLR|nr:MFS transporter [Longilinea arvoryzae]GAP13421.1 arabinose efflux permease [Longilinea arvoryzae]
MLARLRSAQEEYPRQFWLLFWGMMISTIGSSMVWPFLMIYVSEKLQLPLSTITSLMTVNAISGLIFSFIAGPVADRIGRKRIMVISLITDGMAFLLLSQASSYVAFLALMALRGAINPLYRVGADAMMADLIEPQKRADAYSLLRMSNNIGVALGPSIGGFIAGVSYSLAFLTACIGMVTYGVLVLSQARETLPQKAEKGEPEHFGGYDRILRDRPFIRFVFAFLLVSVVASMVWVLLSVYAKQNYNVPESQYGFIATTNALMVVFFQYLVTQKTKLHSPLPVLALGALFYAIGGASIALGRGFWGFWLSMVIMTVGELIMSPTGSTYVANLAPADMRGRYMSLYGLSSSLATGIGPLLGGFLNDNIAPVAIWYGAGVFGLIGTLAFLALTIRQRRTSNTIPASS